MQHFVFQVQQITEIGEFQKHFDFSHNLTKQSITDMAWYPTTAGKQTIEQMAVFDVVLNKL